MAGPGLVDTLQLAVVAVFALPLAAFGLQWLADGRPLGLVFLGIAGLMLLLPYVLTNPFDPADAAEGVAERVAGEEE